MRVVLSFVVSALLCVVCDFGRAAAPTEKSATLSPQHAAFFEQKVRPLLVAKCYECHSQESKILQGGLLLDSRPGWEKGGDSGPAIVPGKPDESLLVRAVQYLKDEFVHMPPKGKMNDDEVAVLVEWVRLGAPDPRVEAAPATHKRTIDIEAGKKHWAFLPLREVKPPQVADDAWSRTPVDRFIQAKLAEAKLQANPIADRRTLVRRAYFDLLGLPPKPAEVEAFVNDAAPDAYEKLIDRLLASPHYGERWGRHWLDLARFAESHGFEQDYDRPNAYHYRDFVIRALNDDLPYDKFVKWQIAGDEYEPENPQALMATGFLAAGVHATQITANQAEKERYDELDDMGRTIGTTMLGLTIGCARCHDHKFDPVTQADYFRIVSTFTKTVRSDYDVNLDPTGYKKALAEFEPRHQKLTAERDKHEEKVVRPALKKWLESKATPDVDADWVVLKPTKTAAPGVVMFDVQGDGTVQARGTQFFALNYTLDAETTLRDIRALRLEALHDDALPHGGPGMTADGGFHLSNVKLQATPREGKGAPTDVKFVRRKVVAGADGKPEVVTKVPGAWTVNKPEGRDQRAVFELEKPVDFESGAKLTLTLQFAGNHQGIGRVRVSLASGNVPEPRGSEISEEALNILMLPAKDAAKSDKKQELTADEMTTVAAWYRTQDAEWRRLDGLVAKSEAGRPTPKVAKVLISGEGLPAVRLHTQGPDFYEKTFVVRRGDPNQKVEEAQPGFVSVLKRTDDESRWRKPAPAHASTGFDRRNLAEWLCDVDAGAGNLLARVIVNRLWYYHTGRGLVATPSDFGFQAEPPSHPELLDYLAGELVRGGWRLKPIHKLIMTSAVYMQTTATDAARTKADPDNKLCWHRSLRRLEAEVVRDAIMAVAGTLDETMFGPGSMDQAQPRRSIYFFVKRSKLTPMMTLFDGPDTLQDLAVRPETTVAPQALLLLNNETLRGYAEAWARKLLAASAGDAAAGIRAAYATAIGRQPTADEAKNAAEFVRAQTASYRTEGKGDAAELTAWTDFCQVLFSLNEFVYVD
ncbi:MAG: hypothetical protein C0483_24710 [Pirellula sp.]|nr:hypothetical protein [Pirellula sp.]